MPETLISVVIPTYNSSSFISKALDSLKAQTFKDFEVVVVNDGSQDKTAQVVDEYIRLNPDLSIRLINQENRGIAGARNRGVRDARAPYIAFLDSDDIWYPEKLKKSYKILAASPDIGLVCHDEYMRDEDSQVIRRLRHGPYAKDMFRRLLFSGNYLSTSAVVAKKSVLLESGLFTEGPLYSTVEDYDLWMKISKKFNMYFLPEPLGEYVINNANASLNYRMHYTNQIRVVQDNFRDYCEKRPFDFLLLNLRVSRICLIIAKDLLRDKKFIPAAGYMFRAAARLFIYA